MGLAGQGWRVVPVWPDKQHPSIKGWPEHATVDPFVIDDWWEKRPEMRVGIVTGKASGVVVLDIDPRNGGDDALHELERSHSACPETVAAETGGGGRHLYFLAPDKPLKTSAGGLAPGLDIRAEGGFVVCPPSPHPSGGTYEWDCHPDDTPLAMLPEWLCGLLTARKPPPGVHGHIAEGGRHDALVRLAGVLVRQGAGPKTLTYALHGFNEEKCKPPLDPDEVEHVVVTSKRWGDPPQWVADPRGFIADKRLDARERLALWALVTSANADGTSRIGAGAVGLVTGLPYEHVKGALNGLRSKGRIEVSERVIRLVPFSHTE